MSFQYMVTAIINHIIICIKGTTPNNNPYYVEYDKVDSNDSLIGKNSKGQTVVLTQSQWNAMLSDEDFKISVSEIYLDWFLLLIN